MGLILFYGDRGLGKSCALGELAQRLGSGVGGVICPGVYADGHKSAVYWLDLARSTGRSADERQAAAKPLARELPAFEGAPGRPRVDLSGEGLLRYGKWEFSRAALAAADEACLRALAEPSAAPAIVDEIGPLELSHGLGYVKTLERLDELFGAGPAAAQGPGHGGPPGRKAVIVALRPELAPLLAERWPGSVLFELSMENRATAAASLAALISSWR
jgi:nucleoside-triphosphatase THEP1